MHSLPAAATAGSSRNHGARVLLEEPEEPGSPSSAVSAHSPARPLWSREGSGDRRSSISSLTGDSRSRRSFFQAAVEAGAHPLRGCTPVQILRVGLGTQYGGLGPRTQD